MPLAQCPKNSNPKIERGVLQGRTTFSIISGPQVSRTCECIRICDVWSFCHATMSNVPMHSFNTDPRLHFAEVCHMWNRFCQRESTKYVPASMFS